MKIPPKLLQIQQLYSDAVSMLTFLYSPEGIQVFTEMAEENFTIAWSELTTQEAHVLLFLLNTAEQFNQAVHYKPELLSLMPYVAYKAFMNALHRLSPYRALLERIEAGELSSFEAKVLGGMVAIEQGEGTTKTIAELNALLPHAA